jgi:serine/threonine-protein kinase
MTPWKQEAFPELEALLSRQIGPMAKLLLKKVAARAEGIDQLAELLLQHIPSERGRGEFQQAIALLKRKLDASGTGSGVDSTGVFRGAATSTGVVAGVAGRSAIRAPLAFDDAWSDAMAQRLTVFIGPIARVVAKRAARQTNDKTEFLQLLSEHIESLPERARFLAEAAAA